MEFSGGCLCGAVRYQGRDPMGGGHCHCVDCRKASGTGHGSHMWLSQDAFTVTGEVKFYESKADSGNTVGRGFCPTCGSAIYSTNSAMPGLVVLRASSLDDPEVFEPQIVVYAAKAASWDPVAQGLPTFDGMPPPEGRPA
ncbi:MAG: GFA family protein [Minwuiales bacterium]|nr:GFA family protein [Minwuiales bacterium]